MFYMKYYCLYWTLTRRQWFYLRKGHLHTYLCPAIVFFTLIIYLAVDAILSAKLLSFNFHQLSIKCQEIQLAIQNRQLGQSLVNALGFLLLWISFLMTANAEHWFWFLVWAILQGKCMTKLVAVCVGHSYPTFTAPGLEYASTELT